MLVSVALSGYAEKNHRPSPPDSPCPFRHKLPFSCANCGANKTPPVNAMIFGKHADKVLLSANTARSMQLTLAILLKGEQHAAHLGNRWIGRSGDRCRRRDSLSTRVKLENISLSGHATHGGFRATGRVDSHQ